MFLLKFEGVFGLGHILYLLLAIILFVIVGMFSYKIREDETKIRKFIRILGIILLVFITSNRIFITYYDVCKMPKEGYTWLNLIPNSYCGVLSFVLAFTAIFGKKDSIVMHAIFYICFVGGMITLVYPYFLGPQTFFDPRSITGLVHHTIMLLIIETSLITKYMMPSMKKWSACILGTSLIVTLGVFEMDALNFPDAMQIHAPFLAGLPVLTSWYMIGFGTVIFQTLFIIWYEMKINKKKFKEIFKK